MHENSSLVSPFFLKQNTGNFKTKTLLTGSHNFNAIQCNENEIETKITLKRHKRTCIFFRK